MKRIVAISDTHNHHEDLNIPECDILIHCGDATTHGTEIETRFFLSWFVEQKAALKIYVPGNHDIAIEDKIVAIPDSIKCLVDNDVTFDGVKIFGSPWRSRPERITSNSRIGFDAFSVLHGDIKSRRSLIPSTDILVTHVPPKYCLDGANGENRGCQALLDRLNDVSVKLHCFGHIHSGYGSFLFENMTMINAAMCNDEEDLVREPVVLDLEKDGTVRFL